MVRKFVPFLVYMFHAVNPSSVTRCTRRSAQNTSKLAEEARQIRVSANMMNSGFHCVHRRRRHSPGISRFGTSSQQMCRIREIRGDDWAWSHSGWISMRLSREARTIIRQSICIMVCILLLLLLSVRTCTSIDSQLFRLINTTATPDAAMAWRDNVLPTFNRYAAATIFTFVPKNKAAIPSNHSCPI